MKLRRYTEQQLRQAIASSQTYAQTLKKLSVCPAGGNYVTLKKAIAYFSLNIDHFRGQGWSKGRKFQPKRPISDYLSNKHFIHSHNLRKRLLREGFFPHQCSNCGLSEWLGSPIPLELDHINGVHSDNSITNLRLLCPNCHAQTPTYRGKNIKVKL